MNIPKDILSAAESFSELQGYMTGGGCDFIARVLETSEDGDRCLLLVDKDSECPESMETQDVEVYEELGKWGEDGDIYKFQTMLEAMEFMQNFVK